jgi:hypothetical protein
MATGKIARDGHVSTTSKLTLLGSLSFGRRVAEEEADDLAAYFVETEQWRKVAAGDVDVVFGAKGSGKSAIYSTLLQREDEFFDAGIMLIPAENPRGTPAFKDLVSDPPASEREFVGLWKLYILSLIGTVLVDYEAFGDSAKEIRSALAREGLLPKGDAPLRTRVKAIFDYVRGLIKMEANVKFDPNTGTPTDFGGKISLGEPSREQAVEGIMSVDSLLGTACRALEENEIVAWLLFDRLDVAFAESRELEANGLKALFKCYLDLATERNIRLKIFLRTDIWKAITDGGFREASHITRQLTISWKNSTLLNLVANRIRQNAAIIGYYGYQQGTLSASEQRSLFDAMVPEKVDKGNNPLTFEWCLGRVKDGAGVLAPRELIHLLTEARDAQVSMGERGEEEPPLQELFSRQAFREALYPVSQVRLEQTIYAEFPEVKDYILRLEQEKTEQSLVTLAAIWNADADQARSIASRLVEIGFFEQRGDKRDPSFWVPFLYRPALQLVQGSAL